MAFHSNDYHRAMTQRGVILCHVTSLDMLGQRLHSQVNAMLILPSATEINYHAQLWSHACCTDMLMVHDVKRRPKQV